MSIQTGDPLRRIAEQVADCFAECGYAFVEDDKIDGLAAVLRSFLTAAAIPINVDTTGSLPTTGDPRSSSTWPAYGA